MAKLKKKSNSKEVFVTITDSVKIRVGVSEFEGIHRLDIREHVTSERYTGFTKKGINIPTNNAEELYKAFGSILEVIKSEGLINEIEEEDEEEEG